MGFNYYQNVLKPHLPSLKQYLQEEEFLELAENLERHKFSMMDMDQNAIIPFLGYRG
jgi:hypothetical protein